MYFCYMRNNKSVLWLTGWYPSSTHPDAGNFIVRHANAFVHSQVNRDQSLGLVLAHFPVYSFWRMLKYGKAVEKPMPNADLMEGAELLWSPVPQFGAGLLGRWVSYQYYKWRVARVLRRWVKDNGMPLGVHVHAADKVMRVVPGFLDYCLAAFGKRMPFWYTEHWAIFNDVVFDGFGKRNAVFRGDMIKMWSRVDIAAPVSLHSHAQMQRYLGGAKPFVLFPNVVDTKIFRKISGLEGAKGTDVFTFLHVSSLEPRKNVAGIVRAFAQLKLRFPGDALELRIVGGGSERFLSEARTVAVALGLLHVVNPSVRFLGNLNSEAVAIEMQNADALVLFSEMENAPCVISEALCCGLPVISSAVAGIPEMLNHDNGLMVDSGDEKGLVMAMEKAMGDSVTWDREKIAAAAQRIYGFDAVGEILNESYRNLM